MTPPGGSRDDDADNAPRDATRPLSINASRREPVTGQGRAGRPGSALDDAGDDARAGEPSHDPQLRAMRAVWLAMRDEGPPDRGLAELLAAARHQAEAMQPRPGAWQRLLAALRRPPVLALATVTVLLAGALLIGRRVPHEAAPGLTTSRAPPDPTRTAAIPPGAGSSVDDRGAGREPAGGYRTGQAADRDRAPAAPAPQPAAPPPAASALPPDRDRGRPAPPTHFAAPPPPPMSPAGSPPGEAARNGDTAGPVPEAPANPPLPPRSERATELGASAAVSGADTAGGNNARLAGRREDRQSSQPAGGAENDAASEVVNATASNAAGNAANNASKNAASPVASGVAAPARRPSAPPRPDAAGDLSRQCEAAAQRGDCATVRRLVDRISRTDRGYRARLAKDSPIGKCLAE